MMRAGLRPQEGRSNKEIARHLGVTEATVKSHVSNLLAKLGLSSRTQAALHAIQIGLVSADGARGTQT